MTSHGSPAAAQRESGAALALCAAAVALYLLHAQYLFRLPVDDAGISVAYARSFAEGAGFRLTPQSAIAEGFSNPSWTLLLAGIEFFGGDSLGWLRPLGLAFGGAALVLLALWGPVAERRPLQLQDALAPLVGAAHPSFVHWVQGGLETSLEVFAIAALGLVGLGTHDRWRANLFGAAGALLILTRPEGPLHAAAAGLGWIGMMLVERRRPGKLELRALAVALVPVLLYLLLRYWYFGEWLPNTYFAKRNWDFGAWAYLRSFYESYAPLCLASFWLLPLGLLGHGRTRVLTVTAGASMFALAYFAYYARGDWMLEWRFLAAVAPFQGAALAAAVSGVRSLAEGNRARELATGVLASSALAWYLIPSELVRSEGVKARGSNVAVTLERGAPYQPAAQVLHDHGMVHTSAIASDIGVAGMGLRDTELWDFAGLTDPATSRQFDGKGGLHFPAFDDFFTHEGPPSLVFSWGHGAFFRQRPYAADYEELSPGLFIVRGLTPTEDPRCPGGKQAVLALAPDVLIATILREATAGEPVRALARWRCAHTYHQDVGLPSLEARNELAREVRKLAQAALDKRKRKLALRHYSLCATVDLLDGGESVPCRKQAELLRRKLFGPFTPR